MEQFIDPLHKILKFAYVFFFQYHIWYIFYGSNENMELILEDERTPTFYS